MDQYSSSEPRRILQVLNSLGRGGIESFVVELYKNIDRNRFQFDFCIAEGRSTEHLEEVVGLGSNVYTYPRLTGKSTIKYILWWHRFFRKHRDYTAIHGHVYTTASIYLRLAHQYCIPTICHSHNTNIRSEGRSKLNMMFRYALLSPLKKAKWVDVRLACSNAAGCWLYGQDSGFEVIHNAIDVDRFSFNQDLRDSYRKRLELEGSFVIGHVGNGLPSKNHMYLLQIFEQIHIMCPKARLLLVGGLHEKRVAIEEWICNHGLDEYVQILGTRNDVPALMMAMDCFCFPSVHEGLGIVLIEAQTSGLPCVVSEAIPTEADIGANLFYALSLAEEPREWAKRIGSIPLKNRKGYAAQASAAGYSVVEVAEYMSTIYETFR